MALPIGEITGLDCYSGFRNMTPLASQVLAQGAGTSDVVRIMWKLSRVSFTQPSLELPMGKKQAVLQSSIQKSAFRQTN